MFICWPGESIVRLSDQSDSKFSDSGLLIGNGVRIGFHAARVKREEETVLAFVLVARLMTVVLAGLRHVANGFLQAIESLSTPVIWVERRELQSFNPCLYCCHLARVEIPRSCPHAHAGVSCLGKKCFLVSLFGFQSSCITCVVVGVGFLRRMLHAGVDCSWPV